VLRHHVRLLRLALLLADGVAAAALFVVVSRFRLGQGWMDAWLNAGGPWWLWAAGYGVLWAAAEWLQNLDQLRARWTFVGEVLDILRAAIIVAVSVFSVLFLVHAPEVSRLFLVILFSVQVAFAILQRRAIRLGLVLSRKRGLGTRNILVLGTSDTSKAVAHQLSQHPAFDYRIVGFLGSPSAACPIVLGPLDHVETVVHDYVVDEIVAALDGDEAAYLAPMASLCEQEGKRLRIVLVPGLAPATGGRIETFGAHEILTVSNGPDRILGLAMKRLIDVVLSALALVVLAPVLLVIAVAVRAEDRGPVLFRQTRVGLHGRSFMVAKFRTMIPDAEDRLADLAGLNEITGHAFKVADDPRITRTGKLLRRTSLDELPQFWNVLRGEMSIVGPRPPLLGEVAGYDLWHRRRLSMKPGITGLWQVSARLEAEFDRWVELDLNYIDRWSLWLDIKIMARTVPAMLSGR
jgi:exopolysaccharide biosynthesis polyprenyl glycosylphosphotransferase